MKLSDHEFSVLAEPGSFKGMMGPAKTETKKKNQTKCNLSFMW